MMIIENYTITENKNLTLRVKVSSFGWETIKVVEILRSDILQGVIKLRYELNDREYTAELCSKVSLIKLQKIQNDIERLKRLESNAKLPNRLTLLNSVQLCETVNITYYELTNMTDQQLYIATGYYKVGKYKKEWLYAKANWIR